MKNRITALILVLSLVTPFITACGNGVKPTEKEVEEPKIFAEGILSEENLTLSNEGVGIELDLVNLSDETKVTIKQVFDAPLLEEESDVEILVYDFELEGVQSFEGVIDLVIPLEIEGNGVPGAAWLNEETQTWEPVSFTYDESRKSFIISTDHLSKFGVFYVTNEGSRRARIEFLDIYGSGEDGDYLSAINEYASLGQPSTECIDIGISAASEGLQLGGDILGNIVQSAGYMAYGQDVLSSLGDHLGSLGLLFSVVQVTSSIYNGKTNDAIVGSMKTAYTYILGKVASKLSSSVMSASMAAIAIVDYAINKFGTTAVLGRADIYKDAYSEYYSKNNPGYKNSVDWYKQLYPMFSSGQFSEADLKAEIDKIVTSHSKEFWSDDTTVAAYMDQVSKVKFTGGGGLNEAIKKELSDEKRFIIFDQILPGVFMQIAKKLKIENENNLRASYRELSNYLNESVSFNIVDSEKEYAKHLVRFAPLNDKAIVSNWTGKIRDDGGLATKFTLYSHMYVGSPNQLQIFEPDANIDEDEPIRIIEFKVSPPAIEIDLGGKIPTVDEINGLWSTGSIIITDFDLGPPPAPKESGAKDSEVLEGCDLENIDVYNMVKAALEENKGKLLPLKMEFQLDEDGIGIINFLENEDEEMDISFGNTTLNAKYNNGNIEATTTEDGGEINFFGEIRKNQEDKIILTGEFNFKQKDLELMSGTWNGIK